MHHHPASKVVTKKTKPNGFAIFMQDIRDRYREEGQRVPSMAEMVNIANPHWSNLSQQDKAYFNQRAKVASKSGISMAKVVADTRLDCIGEPIADRVDEKGQIEERRKSERHFTRARFGVGKSAAKCRFFFIDFQFICKIEKGNYVPCEVAAIEYSIECGIIRTWHKFIDPGKIPTGYRYEAQNRSEQVHKVPIDKFELAESDYGLILEELQHFINPHRECEFPPIFARKEEAEMVESCCRWLAERTDTGHELFKVYVLEYLLIDLSGHVSDISPSPHEAKDMLSSSAFDYETGTNCAWHESREVRYCSQGMVNRHAYIFSDHLCPKYHITMGPTHLPLVKESQQQTVVSPGPQDSDVVFPSRDIRYFPSQQQSNTFPKYKYDIEDNESIASFTTEVTNNSYPPGQTVRPPPASSPIPVARKGRGRSRFKVPGSAGNHDPPVVGGASSTLGTIGDTLRDIDSECVTNTEVAFGALNLNSADTQVNQSPHSADTTKDPPPPVSGYSQIPNSSSYLSDTYYNPYPLPPSATLPNTSPLHPATNYYSEPPGAPTQYQQHLYSQQPPNSVSTNPYTAPAPAAVNTVPNSTATTLVNPAVNHYQQPLPPNMRPSVPPTLTQPVSALHPSQPPNNAYAAPPASYQYPQYQAPAALQHTYPYHQQTAYDHFSSYNPSAYGQPQQIPPQTQYPSVPSYGYSQTAPQPVYQPAQQAYAPATAPLQVPHTTQIPPNNSYLQSYATHPPSNPQNIAQYPPPQPHHQMEGPKLNPPLQNGFYQNPQQMPQQGEAAYAPSIMAPAPTYAPHTA